MFTDEGIKIMEKIKTDYPNLATNYNPYMGNFDFELEELAVKFSDIARWLKEFAEEGWCLMFEIDTFYLTNTFRE